VSAFKKKKTKKLVCHCHVRRLCTPTVLHTLLLEQQPSYLTGLLSSSRQSRILRSSTSDLLSTQSSLTNTAARRFSCCDPPFKTVFLHLYALLTVSLVLGLSSRLTCSQDICSRSTVRASDTHMSVFRVL